MEDMYDDKDLQRLYDEEYFSTRSRPPMWIRRAEFIIEKFNPKTVPKQRVPMAAQGFINEYFTPIHSLINRNEEVGKLFDTIYKKKTKRATNRLRLCQKSKVVASSLHIEGEEIFTKGVF